MTVTESKLAQYRLRGAVRAVKAFGDRMPPSQQLREAIAKHSELLADRLDEYAIHGPDAFDPKRKRTSGLDAKLFPKQSKARRTIHEAIGEMQALRDLQSLRARDSKAAPSSLQQEYRAELQTLKSAVEPVKVSNRVWDETDRVDLPIEPLHRGYDLIQGISARERQRLNGIHAASQTDHDALEAAAAAEGMVLVRTESGNFIQIPPDSEHDSDWDLESHELMTSSDR